MPMNPTLTLYELNRLVRDALETDLPDSYWVEAELSEVREVRGHCYMELVQYGNGGPLLGRGFQESRTPVARASAKCWQTKWQQIRPRFEQVTGQPLHAGMKVLLSVSANFHEAYGFSWIVDDIDPTYTIGDMARKRQEIIRTLHEEGVFDLQKELILSPFAQRIAVISSENAAGYGDFCNQLADNEYGFQFHTRLFPAIMQGEQVEESIIEALNRIYSLSPRSAEGRLQGKNPSPEGEGDWEWDAVVIIRGGGATADLSGFNTLALAENVAQFPIPIITGIGHDRDESILDMVSHTRVKTPTAAAAFLIDNLSRTWEKLENMQTAAVNTIRQRLATEQLHIERLAGRLVPAAQALLTNRKHRLQLIEQRIELLDPRRLLQRGYSMTLKDGHIVSDSSELKEGDTIETRLAKGRIWSVVKERPLPRPKG